MNQEFGYDRDHWQENLNPDDKRAIRFPYGASLSLGELSRGSFLPCIITESSEIFVSSDHAYDLALGKECRIDAIKAYVRYLKSVCDYDEPGINWFHLEGVYNRVIWACACGIPQARMAEDLSNLRTYWLSRLCKQEVQHRENGGDPCFVQAENCGENEAGCADALAKDGE